MDAKTKNKTGTLTVGNNNWDFPILPGTVGPEVVDISKLYSVAGMFTYDPGFTSTASCESKITYIDGDEGILLYRGYPIEQLAEHGDFLETCYLLLYGEVPTAAWDTVALSVRAGVTERAVGGQRRLPGDLLSAALRRTADRGAETRLRLS